MSRTSIHAFSGVVLLAAALLGFAAVPDRPPPPEERTQVQIVVKVPGAHAKFLNTRLEVAIYEYHPQVKGQERLVAKYTDNGFAHNPPNKTNKPITLILSGPVQPQLHYYATVDAFSGNKRTLVGDLDGKRGLAQILSAGKPANALMIIREAKYSDIVLDMGGEIRRGNDAKSAAIAKARWKDFEEFYDIAEQYRPRSKGGMGWGSTSSNPPNQDGLEMKLRTLSRGIPANFFQDVKNNEEAASWIVAIADLTAASNMPFKEAGRKTKADWAKKSAALRDEAVVFSKAISVQNGQAVQKSALALTNMCNACHEIYRD